MIWELTTAGPRLHSQLNDELVAALMNNCSDSRIAAAGARAAPAQLAALVKSDDGEFELVLSPPVLDVKRRFSADQIYAVDIDPAGDATAIHSGDSFQSTDSGRGGSNATTFKMRPDVKRRGFADRANDVSLDTPGRNKGAAILAVAFFGGSAGAPGCCGAGRPS